MKEFLRFLMCMIIVATLVFVYMFLTDQNNNYLNNNKDTENTRDISVDIENSGDKKVENLFSGDDLKNNVESGESINKFEQNNNKFVIEDSKKDEHQEAKPVEEIQENKPVAKPELSGDTLLPTVDEKAISGD